MKNDIHHLGHQNQKKRNFVVIIDNQKLNKNYSDYTLKNVTKKVTKDLLGSKKEIIFHLEEKGKSEKKYGPYKGHKESGEFFVKKHKKMSGGVIGQAYTQSSPQKKWEENRQENKKKEEYAAAAAAAAAKGVPQIVNQSLTQSFNSLSRANTPTAEVVKEVVNVAQSAVTNIASPNSNKYKKALKDIRNGINALLTSNQ